MAGDIGGEGDSPERQALQVAEKADKLRALQSRISQAAPVSVSPRKDALQVEAAVRSRLRAQIEVLQGVDHLRQQGGFTPVFNLARSAEWGPASKVLTAGEKVSTVELKRAFVALAMEMGLQVSESQVPQSRLVEPSNGRSGLGEMSGIIRAAEAVLGGLEKDGRMGDVPIVIMNRLAIAHGLSSEKDQSQVTAAQREQVRRRAFNDAPEKITNMMAAATKV